MTNTIKAYPSLFAQFVMDTIKHQEKQNLPLGRFILSLSDGKEEGAWPRHFTRTVELSVASKLDPDWTASKIEDLSDTIDDLAISLPDCWSGTKQELRRVKWIITYKIDDKHESGFEFIGSLRDAEAAAQCLAQENALRK